MTTDDTSEFDDIPGTTVFTAQRANRATTSTSSA